MSGRSCSTTTSVASSSAGCRLMSGPNASASRWATPAVGSSRQITLGATAEQRRELDDAAGAGRQLGDEAVGVAAEAEEVDQLGRLRAATASRAGPSAAGTARCSRTTCACRASSASSMTSRTVELGEQQRGLERAPEPAPGRLATRSRSRCRDRGARRAPSTATKPPMALSSVDLPAPFAPMRPTTSFGIGVEVDVVDRDQATEAHRRAGGSQHAAVGVRRDRLARLPAQSTATWAARPSAWVARGQSLLDARGTATSRIQ